ncbi:DUF502 domain-containing protein [Candidatus Omnitrophota bacterium]
MKMIGRIRKYFISGLLVFLPLAITVYFFIIGVNFADGLLGKFLAPIFYKNFGFYVPGLGIIVGVYLIILTGFFVTNYLGKKIYTFFENLLLKFPFFRQVYPAIKEMAHFIFAQDKFSSFKKVVLIEYPRKGMFAFGFLTNDTSEKIAVKIGKDLCNIFIPSAPGPLTGYVILVPRKEIIFTEMTVEDAMRFIVSGGVVNP